ncbi:MAG TPA: hypothetical protein DCG34_02525 [Clostridiales bacterium]|nr:hypothetical protein [Clostridiales bacterium]
MKFKRTIVLVLVTMMSFSFSACTKAGSEDISSDASTQSQSEQNQKVDFEAEEIAQRFVSDFVNRDYESLLSKYSYSEDMKALFSRETMEEVSGQIEKSYGLSTRISGVKIQERAEFLIVTIGVAFPDAALAYNVVFSYDGKLSGFNYNEIASIESFFGVALEGATEIEVTFGDEDFLIEGTLSVPNQNKDSYPVAILIHGSGRHDRDQPIYGNKPFRDITEGLIKNGIAVLRYDKRTMTHNQKYTDITLLNNLTIYDEVIDDAVYAVEFLKKHEAIDQNSIFIIGHSLGGNQAPRIAEISSDVAGIAILAGNVTPMQDMIVTQYEYLLGIDGSYSDKDNEQLDTIRKAVALINSTQLTLETDPSETLGLSPKYWMDIRAYDPIQVAQSLDRPILILQGGRDYQVTTDELEKWKNGLGDKASYKLYEDLNHLFIKGEGPSVPAEYTKAGKVSNEMIEDLASWLLSNIK